MIRKYAVILGNLGNTRDRFCAGYKSNQTTAEMLKQAAAIPMISGVELVGTWDIRPDNAQAVRTLLSESNLQCVSIVPDLFANRDFWKGSLSAVDKNVRQRAIDHITWTCDVARMLSCPTINLWPGQDGYDYLLCADYERERELLADAVTQLASRNVDLNFTLEYKPKEPRTHSYIARMADTLLLCQETRQPNVGVTIDTGHAFMAGEVVGEAIVLSKRAGDRLMHMHFNDNHATTDDDMIVGSVHTVAYLEILYWLDRCGYSGWLSMDQYPYREDGALAISESVQWLEYFSKLLESAREEITRVIQLQDAVETSRLMRALLAGSETALTVAERELTA
jgi:xylose isomerase